MKYINDSFGFVSQYTEKMKEHEKSMSEKYMEKMKKYHACFHGLGYDMDVYFESTWKCEKALKPGAYRDGYESSMRCDIRKKNEIIVTDSGEVLTCDFKIVTIKKRILKSKVYLWDEIELVDDYIADLLKEAQLYKPQV